MWKLMVNMPVNYVETHKHANTCTHTHTRTHTHAYTRARTHTYTHLCASSICVLLPSSACVTACWSSWPGDASWYVTVRPWGRTAADLCMLSLYCSHCQAATPASKGIRGPVLEVAEWGLSSTRMGAISCKHVGERFAMYNSTYYFLIYYTSNNNIYFTFKY